MRGLCSWCQEALGVFPCPDPQCPDISALCKECDPIFKFCPDHVFMMDADPETGELIPKFVWDHSLPADVNRMLALARQRLESDDLLCECGGIYELCPDIQFSDTLGVGSCIRVVCGDCETTLTERVVWNPTASEFHRRKLREWKLLLGALEMATRTVETRSPDGVKIEVLHPEWEEYLGEDLAMRFRGIVRAAKDKLYRSTVAREEE